MYGNNQQPPGYGGQPPPAAPPDGGPYRQPSYNPNYNQASPPYGAPPASAPAPAAAPTMAPPQYAQQQQQQQQQQPQQAMAYPAQPYATQQNCIQPGMSTATTAKPYQPAQPYQPYTVVAQQQMVKPQNCMIFAILVTIFCNCPLGALAWIFSCLSDTAFNQGDHVKAQSRGRVSMALSLVGILITNTIILFIAIPMAVVSAYPDVNPGV